MMKLLLLILLPSAIFCTGSYAQKKYGYAVLYLRCGNNDPLRNKVYFSPIIELNFLHFNKYTDGVDPALPKYSVRYYNYAIAKWFELYLKEKYAIVVNDPEKYERDAFSVILNESHEGCNGEKINRECFYTEREKLVLQRNNAINKSKLVTDENKICEVIPL